MRDKIYFMVEWQPDNRERSWSGTNWGLYKHLDEFYSIDDVDIFIPKTFLNRVLWKSYELSGGLIGKSQILDKQEKAMSILAHYKTSAERKKIIFQFQDVVTDDTTYKTYVYQDLSILFVKSLHDSKPAEFAYCGFQKLPIQYIRLRCKQQMKYYQQAAGIFTMGQWLKDFLVKDCGLPESKVFHVGGGINIDKSKIDQNTKKTGTRILFVGRDFIRKGLPELYSAFQILKKTMPEAELYVAGPSTNPYPQAEKGYHYMGDCSHEKLAELFNICDIFAMPSHFEAYGLVFIEALCFGLPCLARNAYEMSYFIDNGKTGFLIDNYNADNIAMHLKMLLENDEIKKNVISKRDWYLKEYSWENVAKRISEVINRRTFNK